MSVLPLLLMIAASCTTMAGTDTASHYEGTSPRARGFNHYLAGVIYQRNGRFEEAAGEYKIAAKLLPDSPGLQTEMAQFFYLLQDFDSAAEACERALDLKPEDAGLWAFMGRIEDERGNFDESAAALHKAVELAPDDPRSLLQLIQAEQRSNDLVGAIQMCERLVQLAPDRPEVHLQLGMTLARINDLDGAKAALEKALELDGSLFQAQYLLGIIYLENEEYEKSATAFESYIEHQPSDEDPMADASVGSVERAREFLAGAKARTGDYAAALREITRVTNAPDVDPSTQFDRIYLLLRNGLAAEAAEAPLPGEGPIFGTLLRAMARKANGDPYEKLLSTLDETAGDADAEVTEFLSDMQYLFGVNDVGTYFNTAIEEFAAEGLASRNLRFIQARNLVYLERREEAVKVFEDMLTTYGDEKWVHYYLGTLYDELDRFPEAERHLKACLDADPLDPEVMNFLGYMYAEHNTNLNDAEKLLKRALEMDPNNGYYLDSLGWIYFRKGKAEESIKLIRQAIVAMDRDDAVLRDHLGDAYMLNGEVDKAIDHWHRALRLDPALEGVQEKIDTHSSSGQAKNTTASENALSSGVSL